MKTSTDRPVTPDGSWTHSFEEDESNLRVYRPTHSFVFPSSRRRRETLEFDADGHVTIGVAGPDDRLQTTSSSLTALGMNRFRLESAAGSAGQVLELVESAPDMLKLRLG